MIEIDTDADLFEAQFDSARRIVRPDGSIRHGHCVGIGIDVTEQDDLSRALRKRDEELRQMLDLAPHLVGILGPRHERHYANRVALVYYGVSLDEWRQRDFELEVHPDDYDRAKGFVDHSLSHSDAFELEMRLRKGDGTYRWFLVQFNPLRDDQGALIRWYVASTEIDDCDGTEERVQQENVAPREEVAKASMFEEIVGVAPSLTA